jgi:hypothetical protein
MAKLIVQHDTDPGIAIVIAVRYDDDGDPLYYGTCTQCGHQISDDGPIYHETDATAYADSHIHSHEVADDV